MTVTQRTTEVAGTRPDAGDGLLLWAAWLFTAAVVIHNSDHLRRGTDAVASDVFWVGTLGVVIEVGVVVLVCQRHRLAPLTAAVTGWSLAPAYLAVHFLPERSWVSDSFTSVDGVSALSWLAASLEVLAAVTLGLAGWRVLRRRGGLPSAVRPYGAQQSVGAALHHPAALLMLVANVVIVTASFSQL
ncbi:MAG: hypothetical protein Q8K58_05020 [Acidimicrobiales bacterium]|nr:hypothetical protein [Acidimicrobiales bacterium]